MNLRTIRLAGERRRRALLEADRELDRIVVEVLSGRDPVTGALDHGAVTAAARESGIARSTVYRRLYQAANTVPDSSAPAPAPADPDLD